MHAFHGTFLSRYALLTGPLFLQPPAGSEVHTDNALVASYAYDPNMRELVSYDTQEVAASKASFIAQHGFLGAMYWELSGDQPPASGKAIVPTVAQRMGELDSRENHLHFPNSKFDNLRKGMGA